MYLIRIEKINGYAWVLTGAILENKTTTYEIYSILILLMVLHSPKPKQRLNIDSEHSTVRERRCTLKGVIVNSQI